MPPPGRSCDLGANQEVGIFHGRMEQGIRAGTLPSAAAAAAAGLHRGTGRGETEGHSGQQGEKIPNLCLSTPFFGFVCLFVCFGLWLKSLHCRAMDN